MQNFKFLSQNFIKFNIQGVFRNPQDEQIPKVSLEFQFDQDLIEKIRKHFVYFLMISTVCYFGRDIHRYSQSNLVILYKSWCICNIFGIILPLISYHVTKIILSPTSYNCNKLKWWNMKGGVTQPGVYNCSLNTNLSSHCFF